MSTVPASIFVHESVRQSTAVSRVHRSGDEAAEVRGPQTRMGGAGRVAVGQHLAQPVLPARHDADRGALPGQGECRHLREPARHRGLPRAHFSGKNDKSLARLHAARDAGLDSRITGLATDLQHWAPDAPVAAVICTPAAFADLSPAERERVITLLQSATADGGVHLVETIVAGQVALTEDELRTHYRDWDVRFVADTGDARTFVATKHVM